MAEEWRDATAVHSEFIVEHDARSCRWRHQRMIKIGDRDTRTDDWIDGHPTDQRNIDARKRGVY